jgi:hypothetical protein
VRSYYDQTLKEEGFTIDVLMNSGNRYARLTDPYDSTYFLVDDSTGDVEIWYPKQFSVTYTRSKPDPEYLRQMQFPPNVPTQISYVKLADAVQIKRNGYFIEQRSWVNQGYWSWKNLADQLPFDYYLYQL